MLQFKKKKKRKKKIEETKIKIVAVDTNVPGDIKKELKNRHQVTPQAV